MGQVRWVGWTVAIATALAISGGEAARADVASDKPAAIVVYPKVEVDSSAGKDTVIRLTNTNDLTPILAQCFYVDANSHCAGGSDAGDICTGNPQICGGGGICTPSWLEIDFRIQLTPSQPIEWKVSDGLADARQCLSGPNSSLPCRIDADCPSSTCSTGLPLPFGVCQRNPFQRCGSDGDCNPFPGGSCTQSNVGTRIPPVPEDSFVGELKCIAIDPANGIPVARNELKGEALLETSTESNLDVASYNAIGIQATGASTGANNELILGGPDAEYNGCPNYLILNHFFEGVRDPVPGSDNSIETRLVLVPCSEDLLRQVPGSAVIQYLVFNEFEQRLSFSRSVKCFQDIRLCNIDTPNCARSIWSAATMGSVSGQTRMNAVPGSSVGAPPVLPSAVLGVAFEAHRSPASATAPSGTVRSAAFNLHMQGSRDLADIITIP